MLTQILKYNDSYRTDMIALWERSVRATHHFLTSENIEHLIPQVEAIDFNSFDVYCVFDETNTMVGILGVEGDSLEMLFLDPKFIGKGIGKKIILFALNDLHVTRVDVNEDNHHAVDFYKKFGFKVYERTLTDGHGNPYPILKMKL